MSTMNNPTSRMQILDDRAYYLDLKHSAEGLPTGDIRNIKLNTYNKIIDTLNEALNGRMRVMNERIANYLADMKSEIQIVMEWQTN